MRVVFQTILCSAKYRILRASWGAAPLTPPPPPSSKLTCYRAYSAPRPPTGVGNGLQYLHVVSSAVAYRAFGMIDNTANILLPNAFWQSRTFYPSHVVLASFWHCLQLFRLSLRLFYQRPGKDASSPWVNQDSGCEC